MNSSGVLLGIVATTETMAHYSHFLDGPLGIAGVLLMAAAGGLLLLGRREPALPHLDPLGTARIREASPADG